MTAGDRWARVAGDNRLGVQHHCLTPPPVLGVSSVWAFRQARLQPVLRVRLSSQLARTVPRRRSAGQSDSTVCSDSRIRICRPMQVRNLAAGEECDLVFDEQIGGGRRRRSPNVPALKPKTGPRCSEAARRLGHHRDHLAAGQRQLGGGGRFREVAENGPNASSRTGFVDDLQGEQDRVRGERRAPVCISRGTLQLRNRSPAVSLRRSSPKSDRFHRRPRRVLHGTEQATRLGKALWAGALYNASHRAALWAEVMMAILHRLANESERRDC